MNRPVLRIFSYLPNPRVWKAQIAGEFCGVTVAVNGAPPAELGSWLWDFDARPLPEAERTEASPHARTSRRGFSGTLYKTDAFLRAHPFGTVPAAFSPDGTVGIFESNSILRAVGRRGGGLYGRDDYEATRIDSFLDASLVFARETQEYLLSLREMKPELHARMASAYEFYLDGIERALVENRFVAGNELTLADISFACDLGQFLTERRARRRLADRELAPISDGEPKAHPRAFAHLFELAAAPEFSKYMGTYLDLAREDIGPLEDPALKETPK